MSCKGIDRFCFFGDDIVPLFLLSVLLSSSISLSANFVVSLTIESSFKASSSLACLLERSFSSWLISSCASFFFFSDCIFFSLLSGIVKAWPDKAVYSFTYLMAINITSLKATYRERKSDVWPIELKGNMKLYWILCNFFIRSIWSGSGLNNLILTKNRCLTIS